MTICLVTGAFDILHYGHVSMLEFAHQSGPDTLIMVAIDSDRKIRETKGPSRPYHTQEQRKFILESFKYVHTVVVFDSEQELENLCKELKPDIRICGSDWKGKKIVGGEYCKEIVYYDRIGSLSTTEILNYEKSRY